VHVEWMKHEGNVMVSTQGSWKWTMFQLVSMSVILRVRLWKQSCLQLRGDVDTEKKQQGLTQVIQSVQLFRDEN
jgi:hypothetical protein